jgi:hypothetical protein
MDNLQLPHCINHCAFSGVVDVRMGRDVANKKAFEGENFCLAGLLVQGANG